MKTKQKLSYSVRAKLVSKAGAANLRLRELRELFTSLEAAFSEEKFAAPGTTHQLYRTLELASYYAAKVQQMLIEVAHVAADEVPAEELMYPVTISAEEKTSVADPQPANTNAVNAFAASSQRAQFVAALTNDANMLRSMANRLTTTAERVQFLEERLNDLMRPVPDSGTLILRAAKSITTPNSRQRQQPE